MPKSRELRPLGNEPKQKIDIPELKPMKKVERSTKSITLKELSLQFDESWKLAIKEIQSIGKLVKRLATEMYKQNAEIEKELKKKVTKEELATIWEAIDKRTQDLSKQLKIVRKETHKMDSGTGKSVDVSSEIVDIIEKENKKFEELLVKQEQMLKESIEKTVEFMKPKEIVIPELIEKEEEEEQTEIPKDKGGLLDNIEKHLIDFNERALGRFIETKAILNDIELNILSRQQEFKEIIEELRNENENSNNQNNKKMTKDLAEKESDNSDLENENVIEMED